MRGRGGRLGESCAQTYGGLRVTGQVKAGFLLPVSIQV
jgi:hypothetical protein